MPDSYRALVLLLLLLLGCSSRGSGSDPAADTTSGADSASDARIEVSPEVSPEVSRGLDVMVDTTPDLQHPFPWVPGPPDPAVVIHDPPFVQERNHTWNEAEWNGPLVALVDPPDAWSGWDRPTLVTPRGPLLRDDGLLQEHAIPGDAGDLTEAVTALGAVYLTGPDALYRVDEGGAATLVYTIPEGDEIWRIRGDPEGVDMTTSMGFARWDGTETTFPYLDQYTEVVSLRTDGRLFLASDYYVIEVMDKPGELLSFPALTLDVDVGTPVALLPQVTLPEELDFVLIGTAGIAGYQETDDGWERVEVPLFAADRIPFAGARRAVRDQNGGFVVAADGGAYRLVDDEIGPEWRVYAAERWMPDGDARDVLPVDDGGLGELWFATAKGPGWVTRNEWTLLDKTGPMIQRIVDRHDRDGAVSDCHLTTPGDLSTYIPWDSDNDGGWTCYWVLAECLRWKITGDPEAKAHFDKSLDRMLSLRTLTGTDWFLARSVIRIDGCLLDDCDGPDDGEWFLSPDGEWWVKADTSNDEVTSHMFMMGHAYDLCADEEQQEAIAAHVSGIIGGIMDHDWFLLDPQDMEPTKYGQWDPFYVNDWPAGAWADGGRRSAQILGALNIAYHVTGEERFLEGKAFLMEEHHYDENVMNMGNVDVYPFCAGSGDCDELGFQAFMPLLRYEPDPILREQWMIGWRRMYDHLVFQEGLVFDLLNAVFEGEDVDLSRGARWFRRYPTDLIRFHMYNQGRADTIPPPDYYLTQAPDAPYFMRSDGHIFPADERPNDRHNTPQFRLNGGLGAGREMDDADVLFAYWLGRYHGFIAPPAGTDG